MGSESPYDAVVFWVSRHALIPSQLKELRRLLGNYRLVPVTGRVPSAEYIVNLVMKTRERRKVVIPVLPLEMIRRLVKYGRKYGFEVWYSVMDTVATGDGSKPLPDVNPSEHVLLTYPNGTWVLKKFRCFKRVVDVVVLLEEVGGGGGE